MTVVGTSIPRFEAPAKVAGRARYVGDLSVRGMLHASLVRSPYPRATVTGIDAAASLAIPGVVCVISALDVGTHLPGLRPFDLACAAMERDPAAPNLVGDAQLLGREVRYVGEPVAIVVAESEDAAADAAGLLEVEYEMQAGVLDVDAARAPDAPLVHAAAAGNVASRLARRLGDPDPAFAAAALVVEATFRTARQKHAQLEPTGCLAAVGEDGRITVWTPHQAPHRARYTLARLFGMPANRVRVIVPSVGGAFGKNDALTAEPYAIAASLVSGRPVRLLFSRQEDFVGTESRHATSTTLALALRDDGTILAIRGRTVVDAGAYLSHSAAINAVILSHLVASYRIEHADLEGVCVYTNTPVSGAFRGYGGPQASLPLEHLIDVGCRRLGVDPVEARLRMRLRPGDPWGYQGDPVDGDGHRLVLERGAAAIGWETERSRPPGTGRRRRGVGAASTLWKSGIVGKGLDHSAASVRLTPDGTVLVSTAAADLGTGIRTTLAQICADTLGQPVASIVVAENDTDATPYDTGAFASRSLFRAGLAVRAAADGLRERILAQASGMLEIGASDLELVHGAVRPKCAPERAVSLDTVVQAALMAGLELAGHGDAPRATAPSFAAAFAIVEVDTETGQVEVERVVLAQDVGRAINPAIVSGQIRGAAHQGLGYALTEGLVIDPESGTVLNGTFMDYRLLTSADTPPIEVVLIEEAAREGPFGARGAGEPGIVVTAPAVANAILDAGGAAPTETPFTPERVLAVLEAQAVEATPVG
jgi:xanthine dehydrogenase molybdenum-binding subunit